MCQVLGVQIGIRHVLGFIYHVAGKMDYRIVGYIPVAFSIMDICIRHRIRSPHGKIMNPQSRRCHAMPLVIMGHMVHLRPWASRFDELQPEG